MNKNKPKVFVMMSGGVDSSVSAFLLKKSGKYEIIGAFIKGYNIDGCQEKEAEDARRVAEFLGIPFYTIDLEKEYKKLVVDYMIAGYKNGITPNPDVMCNKEIKFGLFLKKALELGADFVATGHYVSIRAVKSKMETGKRGNLKSSLLLPFHFQLLEAKDLNKDQSYFLWTLTQEQLKHCFFPIGEYLKSDVRAIAQKAGISTAEKKDSQGICFLGQFNVKDFLKQFLPSMKGDIITVDGKKIGEHDGAWFYTIGQRHLGVGNVKSKMENEKKDHKPIYVVEKNIKTNTLVVAEGENAPTLYKKEILVTQVNFLNFPTIGQLISSSFKFPVKVLVRVRYRQPLTPAILSCKSLKVGCKLEFLQPQKFIASGQSAVFYTNDGQMLGGGVIV